ncbi:MAG: hypothetical protein D4R97_00415 [Bacteroidetes bacterium]|nr:MAG: hypothetical protein D4R97_00415 [Bacteroidota bacterium]
MKMIKFLVKIKPGVQKRTLLLIAGCAWSIAGGILISRSLIHLIGVNHLLAMELGIGIIFGSFFYLLLFARISKKHITRINLIEIDNPCFFSFFNFRSYLLMAIMISGGITLRLSGLVNPEIIYTFFLCMGIPLLVSAWRFFYSYAKNKKSP